MGLEEEEVYDPSALVSEPQQIKVLDFLVKEQTRLHKFKDYEATQKSSTNKTTNYNDTATGTSLSNSGYETTFDQTTLNLNEQFLNHMHSNIEKIVMKIDYKMRGLKIIEQKKQLIYEKIHQVFFKRITEEPFHNIKISFESQDQNPKPLSTAEKISIYNMLFTGLQMHPCLLVSLLTFESQSNALVKSNSSYYLSPLNFVQLTASIFGAVNSDERKETLYLLVLEKVLEWELGENISSEEIHFFPMNLLEG